VTAEIIATPEIETVIETTEIDIEIVKGIKVVRADVLALRTSVERSAHPQRMETTQLSLIRKNESLFLLKID